MIGYRVLAACAACFCLVWAPAYAGTTTTTSSTTQHVKFTSSIQVTLADGQRHGVFTITCKPRTAADLQHASWMGECNKLGRAAIDSAVARKLIKPVKGVAFVKPSDLPSSLHLESMKFSRTIPLIGEQI